MCFYSVFLIHAVYPLIAVTISFGFRLQVSLPTYINGSTVCQMKDPPSMLLESSKMKTTPWGVQFINDTSENCTYFYNESTTASSEGIIGSKEIYVRESENLMLSCNVNKYDQILRILGPNNIDIDEVVMDEDKITIRMDRVSAKNTGVFACLDENDQERDSWNIIVLGALKIHISSKPKCIHYENTQIVCKTSENVSFDFWTHSQNGVLLQTIKGKDELRKNSLDVTLCGYQDAGNYSCRMTDLTGKMVTRTRFLRVLAPPVVTMEIHEIIKSNKAANEGQNTEISESATLQVFFYSDPRPILVEWLRHGKNISNGNKFHQGTVSRLVQLKVYRKTVPTDGYMTFMNISTFVKSDLGEYTIRIHNGYGQVSTVINLQPAKSGETYNLFIYIGVGALCGLLVVMVVIILVVRCWIHHNKKVEEVPRHYMSLDDLLDQKKPEHVYRHLNSK